MPKPSQPPRTTPNLAGGLNTVLSKCVNIEEQKPGEELGVSYSPSWHLALTQSVALGKDVTEIADRITNP